MDLLPGGCIPPLDSFGVYSYTIEVDRIKSVEEKNMSAFLSRLSRLILGLFLYALGITVTMKAHIGYAPWEVFHAGISKTSGISIGTVSIIAGLLIVSLTVFFGEKLGFGTVLNMVLIGIFLDMLLNIANFPTMDRFIPGLLMLIAGLFIIALASYFYIGSGFGAGPRDSLMVSLRRKTGLPIGVCRGGIELAAVTIGWLLGGMVGIGTVISAFVIGFAVQTTFRILKFDAAAVKHETLGETLNGIRQLCKNQI